MSPLSDPAIIVGVDGSSPGAAAVTWAARRAALTRTRIHLVHAFAADLPMLGFGEVDDRDVITTYANNLLRDATARVHSLAPEVHVTTSLARGFAASALIASSHDAVAVVIGATGHGLLSRMSIGAVAMQVATHAASPVVLVGDNQGAHSAGGRVVVGVDTSENSLRALDRAVREAVLTAVPLEVVHVWQASSPADPTLLGGSSWPRYEQQINEAVARTLATAGPHAELPVSVQVARGNPATVLAERSEGASLVVVGARGAGGFSGLHVGSVALALLGHSRAPLALIR